MLKQIRIDGLDYKIGLLPSTVNEDYGRVTYRTCEIWLDETMPGEKQYEILFHEIFHVLSTNRSSGLKEN
ncbi:MAG: hypothetical protein WCY09_08855, partial [Candidatus Omnitrophota bacterium]